MARQRTQTKASGSNGLSLQDTNMEAQMIEVGRRIFDLDARDFVDVVKKGEFKPVENANEAMAEVGHDAAKFLEVINAGLRSFKRDQLADSTEPWSVESEDGTLQPFAGTVLSEEKGKQLNVTVLHIAKTLFGYNDAEKITDATERSKARAAAKKAALDMILSNPGSVEALKK